MASHPFTSPGSVQGTRDLIIIASCLRIITVAYHKFHMYGKTSHTIWIPCNYQLAKKRLQTKQLSLEYKHASSGLPVLLVYESQQQHNKTDSTIGACVCHDVFADTKNSPQNIFSKPQSLIIKVATRKLALYLKIIVLLMYRPADRQSSLTSRIAMWGPLRLTPNIVCIYMCSKLFNNTNMVQCNNTLNDPLFSHSAGHHVTNRSNTSCDNSGLVICDWI